MSLMEAMQLLSNIGDFVAAIAVIVTLGYLAFQVRENTRAVRGSTHQSINASHQVELHWVQEIADLWMKSEEDPPELTPAEAFKLNAWLLSAMNSRQNEYYQYRHGLIGEEKWREIEDVIGNVLSSEWRRRWWRTVGIRHYLSDFRSHVDRVLESESPVDWSNAMGSLTGATKTDRSGVPR